MSIGADICEPTRCNGIDVMVDIYIYIYILVY